jgi:outer membrane protein assembly factor BamB
MGFLSAMAFRPPYRPATLATLLLLILTEGCGGLHVGRQILVRSDDWQTFGRSPLHDSTVDSAIVPPLTLAWEYGLSAGTANGAPIIADSIVVAGTMRGEIHAVRLADGKKIGWVSLGEAIHGTPVISGSMLFVPLTNSRESVVAYELTNGYVRWKQTCGDVETSLLLSGQHLYGGTTEGSFFCLDRGTGAVCWTFSLPENTRHKGIRSSPVAWRSLVVFGADDGCLYALDAATGKLEWTCQAHAPIVAPPAADSSLVVVGTTKGMVLALDVRTGNVRWKRDLGTPVYGHALLRPHVVVVVTTGGSVAALSPTTGEVQWLTEVGGPILAGPSAADTVLFVGTLQREFLALSLSDGRVLWKATTEGRIKTSPVISNGTVIITTDDRSMLAWRGGSKP